MENKYYTPDIEDLRVSYICQNRLTGKGWLDLEILRKDALFISSFVKDLEIGNLRTKYLSKEDIESEGWVKITSALNKYPNAWEKENHFLLFYPTKDNQIEIVMKDVTKDDYLENTSNGRGFAGKCKSINELKIIQKLLNINNVYNKKYTS